MRAFVAGGFAVGFVVAGAGVARAQDHAVLAEALFREGRAAIDAGDLATACAKFDQSYRLDPAPGTLLNLADCEERRGRLATAWERFNRMYDTLSPNDDRRALARSRADAVASRLPHVKLILREGHAGRRARRSRRQWLLDPAAIGTLVPIDPGAHVLVVHVDGHRDEKLELKIAEAEKREVTLHAGPLLPPPPPPVIVPPEHHPLGARRFIGLVVMGAGILALGGGGVVGGVALGTQSQSQKTCSNGVCSDQRGIDLHAQARTQALVADVLFIAGAALVATGAVLFLTGKRLEDDRRARAKRDLPARCVLRIALALGCVAISACSFVVGTNKYVLGGGDAGDDATLAAEAGNDASENDAPSDSGSDTSPCSIAGCLAEAGVCGSGCGVTSASCVAGCQNQPCKNAASRRRPHAGTRAPRLATRARSPRVAKISPHAPTPRPCRLESCVAPRSSWCSRRRAARARRSAPPSARTATRARLMRTSTRRMT